MHIRFAITAALLAMATPAQAEWHVASSENFVIYAEDSEKDLRSFAETLEKYHRSIELVTGRDLAVPSPSNRVTIFSAGDKDDIQALAKTDSRFLQGFYLARAARSVAFVQDMKSTKGKPDAALELLLHEYAHHFLISSQRYPMPRWMSEGAAEFFASAEFLGNGAVRIGRPNVSRSYELFNAADVSIRELLDAELYEKNRGTRYDAFYGRSWLLYHYLMFDQARQGQLTAYWNEFARGTPPIEAGQKIFGDLDQLEDELDRYLKTRRKMEFTVNKDAISLGRIDVRPLSEGFGELMPLVMRSRRGVDAEEAAEVLSEARSIAARYPADAHAQAALAEAELDAGNHAEANAAADRALAADPTIENGYVQKGLALFELAASSTDTDDAYERAMAPFTALAQQEPEHPLPLIYYHRSFAEQGKRVPADAIKALERAADLAPFDMGLAFNVGMIHAFAGRSQEAVDRLGPVAANSHAGSMGRHARHVVDYLYSLEPGDPIDAKYMMSPPAAVETPEL